jgi:hypothetical protein
MLHSVFVCSVPSLTVRFSLNIINQLIFLMMNAKAINFFSKKPLQYLSTDLLPNSCQFSFHCRSDSLTLHHLCSWNCVVKPLKPKLIWIIFKNSVATSKETQHFTITNINRLMQSKTTVLVYTENDRNPWMRDVKAVYFAQNTVLSGWFTCPQHKVVRHYFKLYVVNEQIK